MESLINNLTKHLSPCSGCGKSDLSHQAYNEFFEKRTKGEKVKFILQVEVEADKASNIDLRAIEAASHGSVLSVNPRPQQSVTNSQQSTQRVPTPQIKLNG